MLFVGDYLCAILTMVLSVLPVDDTLMFDQTRLVGVRLWTVFATVVISSMVMFHDQMLVQSIGPQNVLF